jgi:hypothetical protein
MITGMVNSQTIRTAEMADIPAIVFVRGKRPPEEMLELARETGSASLCPLIRCMRLPGFYSWQGCPAG